VAQFDVFRNPNPDSNRYAPYLLDLQSDLLDPLNTRVVAPLLAATTAGSPAAILNPVFEIEGQRCFLSIAELAGVPRQAIGEKVTSLAGEREAILAALDLLFTGF